METDTRDRDLEEALVAEQRPPQLDLYEPLLVDKDTKDLVAANGNAHFLQENAAGNGSKHLAMIGAKVSPIESLDYELIENELFRQDWRSRKRVEILQYVAVKWTFVFLVGLFTGIVAFGINLAVENIAGLKFVYTVNLMTSERFVLAFLVYAGASAILVMLAAMLCVYVGPSAAGSGIPEVKAYLNGVDTPNVFSLNTLFVKVIGSIGSVAGGLIVGKEGPLVHVGACIASLLGQGGSVRYGMTWKWLRYLKNDRDRRDLVTCGAAAGVAAAFRAPVGGVLFALEEVTSWWRGPLLWRAFFTTAVVAVVIRTGIVWCKHGNCGLSGEGGLIIFDISGNPDDYGLQELLPVIILGVVGGLLGSLFNQINSKIIMWSNGWLKKKGKGAKIVQAVVVALITSVCSFGLPWLAKCQPCPKTLGIPGEATCPTYGRTGNFKSFHCPADTYNDLAGLFFNTNEDTIRNLFSKGTNGEFAFSSLIIYLVTSYSLALLTYGIAVPSGLFVPAILCGATYGRIMGMAMKQVYGTAGPMDEGIYALLGAASFLGGSMRMTVSLCIILLELTNNLSLLPLIMLVLLVSKTVGDGFNDALYHLHVQIKDIPFLEAHPLPFMRHLTARDAIMGPLVWFSVIERVGTILEVLHTTKHNAFPVVDDNFDDGKNGRPVFCGLVLRSHLLVLLKKKQFLERREQGGLQHDGTFSPAEFAKPGSGKGAKIHDIDLDIAEEEMFLDLHPVTNTSPYTVVETMSLAKAYTLFRQLGLRHLCVMPKSSEGQPILGLLTRHDFMPNYLLNLHPSLRQSNHRKIHAFPSFCSPTQP